MNKKLRSDIVQWDIENWGMALAFWQAALKNVTGKEDKKVLCLGERDGGISLWVALQGFQVICSDIHDTTKNAQDLHKKYNIQNRMEYEVIDIYRIPYPDNYFEVVACKSVIGGLKLNYKDSSTRTLENQKKAVEEIRRVLKPNGIFLGAENMEGSIIHKWIRKLKKGNKMGWRHLRYIEVQWLFKSFKEIDQKPYGFIGTFYRYSLLNTILSRIDKILSIALHPKWLYINFIVARK